MTIIFQRQLVGHKDRTLCDPLPNAKDCYLMIQLLPLILVFVIAQHQPPLPLP